MAYSEIHFFRFLNRECYEESRNINILVGSWIVLGLKMSTEDGYRPEKSQTFYRYLIISRLTNVIKYCAKMFFQCIRCTCFETL